MGFISSSLICWHVISFPSLVVLVRIPTAILKTSGDCGHLLSSWSLVENFKCDICFFVVVVFGRSLLSVCNSSLYPYFSEFLSRIGGGFFQMLCLLHLIFSCYFSPFACWYYRLQGFPGCIVVKNPPANAGDSEDRGSIPRLGRSYRVRNGNPL